MDASFDTRTAEPRSLSHGLSPPLLQMAALAGIALLWILAIFLLARRMSGALHSALSTWELFIAAMVIVGVSLLLRSGATVRHAALTHRWCRHVVKWGPTLPIMAIAGSLSLPESPRVGLVVLWIAALNGEVWAVQNVVRWEKALGGAGKKVGASRHGKPAQPAATAADTTADTAAGESDQSSGASREPGLIVQEIVRRRSAEGIDIITGRLRAEFVPGQRSVWLHVAFSPPFTHTPEVKVESEDPTMRVKLEQPIPYGARIEVRRPSQPGTGTSIWLQLEVRGDAQATT